jgi:DNA-binding HxlR family transcriptional regulator
MARLFTFAGIIQKHMYQRKIPIDYNCGLTVAMEVVGSKWKFCILDEISKGILRPKDMVNAITGVSKRVLQQQLSELEMHGIVGKTIYPEEVPLRVEYHLTDTGKSLLPLVIAMDKWGEGFAPQLKAIVEQEVV